MTVRDTPIFAIYLCLTIVPGLKTIYVEMMSAYENTWETTRIYYKDFP